MRPQLNSSELISSHMPALQILLGMGYQYVSEEEARKRRSIEHNPKKAPREVLFISSLVNFLRSHTFEFRGQPQQLSTNAIEQVVREISDWSPALGLQGSTKKIHEHLTLGITVTEFVGGHRASVTVPLIDLEKPDRNIWEVTEEFSVQNSKGTGSRRPDIVAFVNGIPVAVIEAKASQIAEKDLVYEAISQHLRNQSDSEIPRLFAYAQLLLAIQPAKARYATTGTPRKFWHVWREEEIDEKLVKKWRNKVPNRQVQKQILKRYPSKAQKQIQDLWNGKSFLVNEQDRLIANLLQPSRLLELIKHYIFYVEGIGKMVARYHQFFGVRRMLERVVQSDEEGRRKGGVIWHATGSGKSYSMMLLSKLLLSTPEVSNCRMVIITDRLDLQDQLKRNFKNSGAFGGEFTAREADNSSASTGRDFALRLGKGNERILFTLMQKFRSALREKDCYNHSKNLIALVDEGHRSQGGHQYEGGKLHKMMRRVMPNAAFIAFTGTPLLKGERKSTERQFGPIIHTYTTQQATKDGTVVPLLYEDRPQLYKLNGSKLDDYIDVVLRNLTDEQKTELKSKIRPKQMVYEADDRIRLIATDLSLHFLKYYKNFRLGLKAQLVTESRRSALRYKKYLDELDHLSSAVVISHPDTREGHTKVENEDELPEIQKWWKNNVGNQKEEDYTRKVVKAFGQDNGPDILIVVRKLLTGFDEPRNSVLYIDRNLEGHELIQAIARVNRCHENKEYGLLIDYRGILKKLDMAIEQYRKLAEQQEKGFSPEEITGIVKRTKEHYQELQSLHDQLLDLFDEVENHNDFEQFKQILTPIIIQDPKGHYFDKNQKRRDDFFHVLNKFGAYLKLALSSNDFYENPSEDFVIRLRDYQRVFEKFTFLRKIVRETLLEDVDVQLYEAEMLKLVDNFVKGERIHEDRGVLSVADLMNQNSQEKSDPKEWPEEKQRNKAEEIKSRLTKTIEVGLEDDPFAQKRFSEMLLEAIKQAEEQFDHPYQQYSIFEHLDKQLRSGELPGYPNELQNDRRLRAYYGVLRMLIEPELAADVPSAKDNEYIKNARLIDEVINNARTRYSLDPIEMKKNIRGQLLGKLFHLTNKRMDLTRELLDSIITMVHHQQD